MSEKLTLNSACRIDSFISGYAYWLYTSEHVHWLIRAVQGECVLHINPEPIQLTSSKERFDVEPNITNEK